MDGTTQTADEPAERAQQPQQPEQTEQAAAPAQETPKSPESPSPRAKSMRVHLLAKEFGIPSRELIAKLNELGEEVRSASAVLKAPVVERVRAAMAEPTSEQEPEETTAAPEEAQETPAAQTSDTRAEDAPAQEAPSQEAAAQEAPAEQTTEAQPRRRRRAASRPAGAPAPVPEALASPFAPSTPVQSEPAADVAPAQPTPDRDSGSTDAEPPQERRAQGEQRSRRRRATRPAAAPEPSGEESGDDIAAALRAAEEAAGARRGNKDDNRDDPSREERLAALAGAIAGTDDEESRPDQRSEDTDRPDEDDDESDESSESDSADDDRPNRRRRRRGGRRRRRGGRDDASDDESDDSDSDSDESDDSNDGETEQKRDDSSDAEPESDDDNGDGDSGSTRRRRRRRRRENDDSSSSSSGDEVTGIEGSTRMEAKRQRRKESRAAGRRRAPILSEAEFLARRESVDRKLVIRQSEEYTQLAVIEDNILVEHYVDKASAASLIGNIYVGKVQNVLPSMEAAFIDIGRGRNAVLYAGEVDWASFGATGENRKVENVLKSGQSVLVQVTKDPVGAKGARLTSHISLPGRYIVYSPGGHLSGISRKLPDAERNRLRNVLGGLISDDESVIVRTAAEGASEEELVRDVNRLKAQWEIIEKKSKTGGAPQALYSEPDLTLRIVRDLFTEDFASLVVQGDGGPEDAYDAISAYVSHVAPHLAERLVRFEPREDGRDAFAEYKIDDQIAKALDRKVFLPSGGSLVIDRTEAMTVIDVNTGRFTGSGGNLEATVTSNNLEAAEEIVRQLRLRDIGGIIVIDFIDMVLPSNRELLLRRLVECLGRDRTRHQVAEVTSLGLVQLTRKKIGTGLAEAFTEQCEHCNGLGYQRFEEPVDSQAPSDGGERKSSSRRRRK
ncbi:translation initiation factor IF-2 N-terminal domain-containing protein [Tessaracoccus flavus]|uniref:Ribonuclease E n=1 Tax=Tessaracoccus flavus TaxID=1610493 RepID=A0A1Q2CJ73_9ACTN|nr:ribonuclease [Tessaracoccus flavus]